MNLADDMTEVRRQLAGLQAMVSAIEARIAAPNGPLAREIELRLLKARRNILPQKYLNNIAWDILLDVDAAERAGEWQTYPGDADAVMASRETQLRYLAALETDGMISLTAAPGDGSHYHVSLTATARLRLDQIFAGKSIVPPTPLAA